MSSEDRGRAGYLDLLITTLMEHEKNLDGLTARLEKIAENLSLVKETALEKEKAVTSNQNTIIFTNEDVIFCMKINKDQPVEDIIKKVKSLNE